jgi:hypothetical protein
MNCTKCGCEIPERRLKALPGTRVCVNCSSTKPVKGIITVIGEGDHTATDIQIVSDEDYKILKNLEKQSSRFKDPSFIETKIGDESIDEIDKTQFKSKLESNES